MTDAGLLLYRLLSEPGRARKQWVAASKTATTPGEVNLSAVAQVIAEHLWDSGERSEQDTDLPRNLKDRIRRALRGGGMTAGTLRWFVDAFSLDKDRRRLEDSFASSEVARSVSGAARAAGLPLADRPRSVSLTEHHYLGADRCPAWHRTTQVLEAHRDGTTTYLYMFDTNTINVVVRQGAKSVGSIRDIAPGVFGVDIELQHPLSAGETTSLTYESFFSYGQPPEPEFRRAAFEGVESLDIRVEFHPNAVPSYIGFAEWDQLSHHQPSRQQQVEVGSDHSVHRFLRTVNNSIVGFRWNWD